MQPGAVSMLGCLDDSMKQRNSKVFRISEILNNYNNNKRSVLVMFPVVIK